MNFTLNGWPPVASHMACVLVGVGLVHLTPRDTASAPLKLPAQMVTLPLAERTARLLQLRSDQTGRQLHLIQGLEDHACRLTQQPLLVLTTKASLALAASYRDTPALLQVLQTQRATRPSANAIRLAPAGAAGSGTALPLCEAQPKVTYGRT